MALFFYGEKNLPEEYLFYTVKVSGREGTGERGRAGIHRRRMRHGMAEAAKRGRTSAMAASLWRLVP